MKKTLLLTAAAFTLFSGAFAAQASERTREKKESPMVKTKAVTPSQVLPTMPNAPEAAPPAASPSAAVPAGQPASPMGMPTATPFPALPKSRPCVADDVKGILKLAAVYEEPAGAELAAFTASPNQYVAFLSNSMFLKANTGAEELSLMAVAQRMRQHSSGLIQYLLQENGFMYFYQDSVAVDVKACFLVAEDLLPFKKGQMILMPPKGQIQGRLVLAYDMLVSEATIINAIRKYKNRGR